MPCSSSSSDSSEDEEEMLLRLAQAAQCSEDQSAKSSSNVVPTAKLKLESPGPVEAAEIASRLPDGAFMSVCQGKTCSRRGAAQILEDLKVQSGSRLQVAPCNCLDKCKMGPNVQIEVNGERRVAQVTSSQKVAAV